MDNEPENWVKSGGRKHDFVREGYPRTVNLVASDSGEIVLHDDWVDVDMHFDLDDQHILLAILADNLQKHRESLGRCPFSAVRLNAPCPLRFEKGANG